MSKQDFLIKNSDFIESEITGAKNTGVIMNADEWEAWIMSEDGATFTDQELGWIIEALDNAGVVIE